MHEIGICKKSKHVSSGRQVAFPDSHGKIINSASWYRSPRTRIGITDNKLANQEGKKKKTNCIEAWRCKNMLLMGTTFSRQRQESAYSELSSEARRFRLLAVLKRRHFLCFLAWRMQVHLETENNSGRVIALGVPGGGTKQRAGRRGRCEKRRDTTLCNSSNDYWGQFGLNPSITCQCVVRALHKTRR